MSERDKVEHARILRGKVRVRRPGKHKRKGGKRSQTGTPPLASLLPAGTTLSVTYKKASYTSTVDADGRTLWNGKLYNSPSSAGAAVKGGKATDGWLFWKYQNPDGKWVLIDEVRKEKATSGS